MSRAASNILLRTAPTRILPRAALTTTTTTTTPPRHQTPATATAPPAPAAALPPARRSLHTTAARRVGLNTPGQQQQQQQQASATGTGRPLLPEFSLQGKVIIVTGAGRGLGLVQAEALLEAGATVYALDRLEHPDPEFARVQQRNKEGNGNGPRLEYVRLDVRDNVSLNAAVARIADDEGGRLDGLLACAGIQQETPALDYTMEDADRMFGVNVTGVLMTAQAVARQMRRLERPGSMAFIASMSAHVANRGLICPAYNASKAGVLQLARNLAMEWGPYGIRVNTISPGYIVTAMTAPLFEQFPDRKENWPKQNMLGRLSYPEEYRGAAVFLLSEASSFMTGSDMRIDGGHASW